MFQKNSEMDIDQKQLDEYIASHTSPEPPLLYELNRKTQIRMMYPRMLSGQLVGRLLSMISHMLKPTKILEIGTFTGYSALCLAEGMHKDGLLHTIDINEELEAQNLKVFKQAGFEKQIIQHIGPAIDIIPKLGTHFDLVFIDADKINYPTYYVSVIDRVKSGGYIIADNVLWGGKVLDSQVEKQDKDTQAIIAFNKMVLNDNRTEKLMLPLRDGIYMIRKI